MVSKWAEVAVINGVRTVTNLVLADEDVAAERGYIPAGNLGIGDREVNGQWAPALVIPPRPDKLERLMDLLESKGIFAHNERPNGPPNGNNGNNGNH
jgi:hypothetical protein